MSVLIEVSRRKAFLRQGEWRCADRELEDRLNAETRRWIRQAGGPRLDEADQEAGVAQEMARRFGGRILLRLRPREPSHSQVYLAYRQLELEFP